MSNYTAPSAERKDRFIRFSNADGKAWVVPVRSMQTALNLYQPSGVKGKLVKSFLPYLHWIPLVRGIIKAESLQIKLEERIEALLCQTLGVESFEFSIFEGTPSVHKKVTIQISQGTKILAYCKLSNSPDVVSLFKHEQNILNTLHEKGVNNVPECLYCGEVSAESDTTIFVQSTIKTNRSQVVHEWRAAQQQFIEDLHQKTKERVPFAESDFAKSLTLLDRYLCKLSPENQEIISDAIKHIRAVYSGGEVEFSAYHADLTPWNMFFENGELFVFDFEYSQMSYPPYLDWFHHFTQTAIFERHLTPEQIAAEFQSCKIANSNTLYRAYLLDVISRYIYRERGDISRNTMENIEFWIAILNKL